MKLADVRKLQPLDRLLYWINERESIRLKKEAGQPPPWTDDTTLQNFRFCNVRRMDDKVSKWLLEHWYQPYFGHKNMVVACALARFLNLPSSLEAVGFPDMWKPSKIRGVLQSIKATGSNYLNGAYVVCGESGVDKVISIVDNYCNPLYASKPIIDTNSLQGTWQSLLPYRGMGSFMAGQVVADLRWALLGAWLDKLSWAPKGPGSVRGMNRLLGKSPEAGIRKEAFTTELLKLIDIYQKRLPANIVGRLEMQDVQSTLCEFDKYERALWGGGRPKAQYPRKVTK